MTATMPRPLALSNGGIRSARWLGGKSDPIARALAIRWGLTPKSAEHLLSGPQSVFHRAAQAIAEFRRQGAHARLVHAVAPIDAALAEATPPALTVELCAEVARAGAQEHEAVLRLLGDMSPDHKKACRGRLERAIAAAQKLLRAVTASLASS